MRTCVACREIAAQATLVRIVATESRLAVDLKRRCKGRGAYVHPGLTCRGIGRGEDAKLASGLARSFRRGVRPGDVAILRADLLGAFASDRDSVERNPQNKAKDDTGSRSKDARL
jgi:predicted RNA-binding protein YlxR (DUF448 family)